MPKKPKSGPPYTDIPSEIYVVVTNPWGMKGNPRERTQGDFNRVASWAQFALQQTGLTGGQIPVIECIYGMGTRDEIILQFSEGTNILPLLGKHRWAEFSKPCQDPRDPRSTCVFLYNWRNNGDPANHNWTENFPSSLPLDTVPAKSPYPAPSWTSPPPSLTNFVVPIPRPPTPPPNPDNARNPGEVLVTSPPSMKTPAPAPEHQTVQMDPGGQPVAENSVSTSLFRPYEPPSQHPSHARFLNKSQTQDGEVSSCQASPPFQKFVKKLDPYELDEDALDFIRSTNPEENTREVTEEDVKSTFDVSVKAEDQKVKIEQDDNQHVIASSPEYQPSQALIDAVSSLGPQESSPSVALPTHCARGFSTVSRNILPSRSGYQPSAELEGEVNAFFRRTAAVPPAGNDRRVLGNHPVIVKREYEGDMVLSPAKKKKIKIEED